ncbi:hypothetical protein ABZV91_09470 [Nocardia sp. NPDC004568]|uniref:hypothetical protein n=1 Tax=Nocardia sp. NPDC004568 TaxID=3154551 RepID=UPI0033B12109
MRNDIAEFHLEIGNDLVDAAELDPALHHFEAACALRRRSVGESRNPIHLMFFLEALASRADCLTRQGRLTEALAVGERRNSASDADSSEVPGGETGSNRRPGRS